MFSLYLLILIITLCVFYAKSKFTKNVWKEKNVPHTKPTPFVGHIGKIIIQKATIFEIIDELYNKFKDKRYFGVYQFIRPTLVIRDPELIKQIGVKDFDYFPDHRPSLPENLDPLWSKNLAATSSENWRQLRPTLSPTFTSSKMKFMHSLILDCAKQFCTYFNDNNTKENVLEVDLKDVFTRYTNDVIASTAFGIKVDSLNEKENEFYLMGKDASNLQGLRALKFFLPPLFMKTFNIKIFSKKVDKFFRSLISNNIKMRLDEGIVRQDMVHLLLEARKGKLRHEEETTVDSGFSIVQESSLGKEKTNLLKLTDEDITAQAIIFFVAGFDTTSSLMCSMAFKLALNPDIQEKLHNEIETVNKETNGEITYEALLKMSYMDMVVTETLRKWPPLALVDRMSAKPYKIPPANKNETEVLLEEKMVVWIPIYSIHHDPEYYPEPEKFNPERFSEENKSRIKPYTYLPFGVGPRNCIGSRFAILETKTLFFNLLKDFEIVPTKKTPIKFKLNPKMFNPSPIGGYWLGFKKRISN